MRLAMHKVLAGGLLTLLMAGLGACGGGSGATSAGAASASVQTGGKVVDIYSSLPMHGPSARETLALANGIRLALAQAGDKAGAFTVRYTPLDDSTGPAGWDASQTAANARKVAADPRAVYYIGEFDDDASEVSMPILNQAGIPQVSPANTYVGLTTSQPGEESDGADPFAPTGTRTYLRIVPIDSVQAAALLTVTKQARCTRVALASDQEPYGIGLAKLVELEKRDYGVDVVTGAGVDLAAGSFRAFAVALKSAHPDCVLLTGVASRRTVSLTEEVHAALPTARLFAPEGMCTSGWTNSRDGGVPANVDPLIRCTAVTLSPSAYPGGKAFLAAYRATYDVADPSPYAILGYEAMKLGLSTIAGLGTDGDSKSAVLGALFSTTNRHSVLGTYGFDKNGDTTLRSYGLYRVGASGNPVFVKTITPARALTPAPAMSGRRT
jgi:branched-chain amino acid transport system substrate-binding protein